MDDTTGTALLSATASTWMALQERRDRPTDFDDCTHAERPGGGRQAPCGARPGKGPDGTPFPDPQLAGARVCPECLRLAG